MSSSQRLELRQGQSLTDDAAIAAIDQAAAIVPSRARGFRRCRSSNAIRCCSTPTDAPDAAALDPKTLAARRIRPDDPPDLPVRGRPPSAGPRRRNPGQAGGSVRKRGQRRSRRDDAGGVEPRRIISNRSSISRPPIAPLRQAGRYIIHSPQRGRVSRRGHTGDRRGASGSTSRPCCAALRLVQSFDPPGIAARDLAECLRIQLRERGRLDAAMDILLARLDLLARRDHAACAGSAAWTEKRVERDDRRDPQPRSQARPRFRRPRPSTRWCPTFSCGRRPTAVSTIELNGTTVPRLSVDRSYHAEIAQSARSKADQAFLSRMRPKRRAGSPAPSTSAPPPSSRSASEIVRQQESFFHHGAGHLRPHDPALGRGSHRDARIDRFAGHRQQGARVGSRARFR